MVNLEDFIKRLEIIVENNFTQNELYSFASIEHLRSIKPKALM
jgi:hypothetical protein